MVGKVDKVDNVDKVDKAEQVGKVDKADKISKVCKMSKVDRVDIVGKDDKLIVVTHAHLEKSVNLEVDVGDDHEGEYVLEHNRYHCVTKTEKIQTWSEGNLSKHGLSPSKTVFIVCTDSFS